MDAKDKLLSFAGFDAVAGNDTETAESKYPLPPKGVLPSPTYRRRGGTYLLPNGSGKVSPYNPDTPLTSMFSDSDDDQVSLTSVVAYLADNPEVLSGIDDQNSARGLADSLRSLVTAEAGRFGMAMNQWAWALDAGACGIEEVPDSLRDSLTRYGWALRAYDLSPVEGFYRCLAHNQTTATVSPIQSVYRHNPTGELVLVTLRTGLRIDAAIAADAVRSANIRGSERIYNPRSRVWSPMPEEIRNATAAVLTVPRGEVSTATLNRIDSGVADLALSVAGELNSSVSTLSTRIRETTAEETRVSDLSALVQATNDKKRLAHLFEIYRDQWTDDLSRLGFSVMHKG